jgi:predicted dithiol-disulfide oxidoreductase (DUF899 family)
MSLPWISTREEWLAARSALQVEEDEAVAMLARVAAGAGALPLNPAGVAGPNTMRGGS